MQVMCVLACPHNLVTGNAIDQQVEVGSKYTVIKTTEWEGLLIYKFAETDHKYWFDARCFATLPEQTADEMEAEVKEAILM